MNNSTDNSNADTNTKEIHSKLDRILSNQDLNKTKNKEKSEIHSKIIENISELKTLILKIQGEVHDIRIDLDKKLSSFEGRFEEIGARVKKNNSGVFHWKIDNLCPQQSDAFYSHENGYKMRLQLVPERYWIRQGISLIVKMVQGANDKTLQWPVEFDVRIGILNQENGQFFRSEKQIILFRTSTSTHESQFKFSPYDLSGSAWKNNCLIIKCLVN